MVAFQAMLDKAPTSSGQVPFPASAPASQSNAPDSTSAADQAQRAKQHAACLELAKDNPSITCK
jgi:enamine deaminase RidA (YjgF/YER057c/UK114 family)